MQQVITDLARAQALVDTRRYKDAESVLRRALAQAPLAAEAHSLLAFTLYHQDRNEEALLEARTAVGLTPDAAGPHYVEAVVLLDMGQLDPALRAIKEALRWTRNGRPITPCRVTSTSARRSGGRPCARRKPACSWRIQRTSAV
jgi:tetratricopeptide (TPR) repeat protein